MGVSALRPIVDLDYLIELLNVLRQLRRAKMDMRKTGQEAHASFLSKGIPASARTFFEYPVEEPQDLGVMSHHRWTR